MRPDRTFTTIVVALLVAVAGFTGAVAAAEPAGDTVAQQTAEDVESVEIDEMVVENLSTQMELESANIIVETEDGTEEVTVDSATVELEDATVEVTNATLESNGTLTLDEANITITDGQVDIQSSHGDQSMDLSDTEESVEEVTIELDEVAREELDVTEDLQDVTIQQMTVEGFSGESEIGVLAANAQVEGELETTNVSVAVQNGNVSVDNATIELENATVEDGTLVVESVDTSVDSAEVSAERVVVLCGFELTENEDVQESVEDEQFSQQNVEIDLDFEEWTDMLAQLAATQSIEC